MIYITGDTHGDISCFKNPKLNKLGEKDILIVCGDFGFIWNPHDKNERKNLEYLKKRKYTICFVDGAHENFDILNSYKPYRWKGGNIPQKLPIIFTTLCAVKFSHLKAKAFLLWVAAKVMTLICVKKM